MNMKRISGNPMGGGMIIDHDNCLMLVYQSLHWHCYITFIAQMFMNNIEYHEPGNDGAAKECLLAIEVMYSEYWDELECSQNE